VSEDQQPSAGNPAGQPHAAGEIGPAFVGLLGAVSVAYVLYDIFVGFPPRYNTFMIGRDFVNMWTGARLAVAGEIATLFDWRAYMTELHRLFGDTLTVHNWSYPPHVLLFVWPLAFLPYHVALVVWDGLGLAAYAAAARTACRAMRPDGSPWLVAAALAAPAVTFNIVLGQVGLFVGALVLLAFTWRESRPLLAGLCLGLLTMKPHLGLLWPVLLALEGRWRTIGYGAATTAVLVVVASAVFGWTVFPDYWVYASRTQYYVLTTYGNLDWLMPTVLIMMQTLKLPLAWGWPLVVVVSPLALAGFVWLVRLGASETLKLAMFGTAIILILPYAFTYDTAMLALPLVLIYDGSRIRTTSLLALAVYLLPYVAIISAATFVPFSPLLLIAFAIHLVLTARAERATATAPSPR
jgi:hypothetical protein